MHFQFRSLVSDQTLQCLEFDFQVFPMYWRVEISFFSFQCKRDQWSVLVWWPLAFRKKPAEREIHVLPQGSVGSSSYNLLREELGDGLKSDPHRQFFPFCPSARKAATFRHGCSNFGEGTFLACFANLTFLINAQLKRFLFLLFFF